MSSSMLEDAGSGVTIVSRPPSALSIAEAAKRVGLSTHTVRYYARDGLVLCAVDTQRCAGRATAKVERLALLQAHRARVSALLAEVTDQLALAWVLAQADDIAPIRATSGCATWRRTWGRPRSS